MTLLKLHRLIDFPNCLNFNNLLTNMVEKHSDAGIKTEDAEEKKQISELS